MCLKIPPALFSFLKVHPMNLTNRCRTCGATSYKPVIKRDGSGKMRSSGQYQCVGCRLVFTSINEWRIGAAAQGQPSRSAQ
jgi:hypothetical protein